MKSTKGTLISALNGATSRRKAASSGSLRPIALRIEAHAHEKTRKMTSGNDSMWRRAA